MSDVDVLRSGYEAFEQGDIPHILEKVLDPQIEWHEPGPPELPGSGVHHGPQAVATGLFATVPENWTDFHVRAEEYLEANGDIVVIGRFVGTSKAGKQVDAPFAHRWKFRGGRAVYMQNYSDTAAMLAALQA